MLTGKDEVMVGILEGFSVKDKHGDIIDDQGFFVDDGLCLYQAG